MSEVNKLKVINSAGRKWGGAIIDGSVQGEYVKLYVDNMGNIQICIGSRDGEETWSSGNEFSVDQLLEALVVAVKPHTEENL